MDFDAERKFLLVKERLDALHLPTVFPDQCVELLHRLVEMVPRSQSLAGSAKFESPTAGKNDSTKVRAVTQELQRTIKENNTLHLELIHFKQENQVLKKRIAKLEGGKGGPEQHGLLKMKDEAVRQLQEELAVVTKKYQELLHRAYNKENGFDNLDEQYNEKNMKREFNMAMPDKRFMQLQPNQRQPTSNLRNEQQERAENRSDRLQQRIELLTEKVANRENEILRLHQKLEFDGVNMNRLLKDFQKQETSSRLESLNHQIDLLNKENFRVKEELKKIKNNSSHAQVIRREHEKQKTVNKADKSNFEKEIKKWEEKEFQLGAALKKLTFDFNKQQKLLRQKEEEIDGLKHTMANLAQSAQFHEKEVKAIKERAKEVDSKNISLETGYEQMRNNVESEKIFLSYELEDVKKKFREAEFAVREYQQRNEALQLKLKRADESQGIGAEEDKLKSATLMNQEEIIGEQQRIIAELRLALEVDRKKLRSLERPHESQTVKHSIQGEDERFKLESGKLGASEDYAHNKHFEELSASYQVLTSQKSILERDIRQVRLMNQELQDRLEKANHGYSKNVEELKQANDLLRQDVRQQQLELDSLKATNNSASKAREAAEFELRKLKSELHFLQESLQDAQSAGAQLQRTKAALKKAESNGNVLTQRLAMLEEDKIELTRQLEISEGKLRTQREGERKLKETISRLEDGLSDLQDQKARLQSDYQVSLHRLSEMEHSLNQLVKQVKLRDQRAIELEEEASRTRKDRTKLERKIEDLTKEKLLYEQKSIKQGDLSNTEDEIFWLRRELNSMVEKTDKYVAVNRQLNELAALTKKENEQLLQEQNGYKKQVEHLRLLCQDLELALQKHKLNEQQLLQTIQELEIRFQQLSGGTRWDEQPVDPLKSKVEKVQQQFHKQMRDSKDVISKK